METSEMMSSDVKMLLHGDVIYEILLWLPVISLLRFKSICKSWRALIESSDFIKQHLHHHHDDCPNLNDKNHNLIFCLRLDYSPINFFLTSLHNFEVPAVNLQIEPFELFEHFPVHIDDITSFNGIVCLSIYLPNVTKYFVYLWNPATKQSRLLPNSSFPFMAEVISIGFGFDVKTNDYKVVRLISDFALTEKRAEVYSLSTNSWRSIDPDFPGTVEPYYRKLCIASDKIACVLTVDFQSAHTEIWVLNEYGSANESWAKLHKIDLCSVNDIRQYSWLLMSGNYLFLGTWQQVCRYNLVTKEVKHYPMLEFQEILRFAQYNESLVSVGGENKHLLVKKIMRKS